MKPHMNLRTIKESSLTYDMKSYTTVGLFLNEGLLKVLGAVVDALSDNIIRAPKDHLNIGILPTMVFGIPFILVLGYRM